MKGAEIFIEQQSLEEISPDGIDQITFFIKANKGSKASPIHKTASGGEVSRVMLALKSMISKRIQMPTILFDEIDTGVSGETASKLSKVLASFSQKTQTIVITHLPQVACSKANHLLVSKTIKNTRSITSVKQLNEKERIQEIAKMLSGDNITEAALSNAKTLLSEA